MPKQWIAKDDADKATKQAVLRLVSNGRYGDAVQRSLAVGLASVNDPEVRAELLEKNTQDLTAIFEAGPFPDPVVASEATVKRWLNPSPMGPVQE
jgi:hypothetical protein